MLYQSNKYAGEDRAMQKTLNRLCVYIKTDGVYYISVNQGREMNAVRSAIHPDNRVKTEWNITHILDKNRQKYDCRRIFTTFELFGSRYHGCIEDLSITLNQDSAYFPISGW